MKTEEEIRERIEEIEEHARSLNPQSRLWHRRRIKELNWVLEKK